MTRILTLSPHSPDPDLIRQASDIILRRGLVAFPTETVYGLGANALDEESVAKIFEAKGRPSNDPLIVHLASVEDIPRLAFEIPPIVQKLANAFWPGPLTLILPKQAHVPDSVTSGLNTVAVRVPSHPIALALIQASGVPIAAPSANRFGHTSPTTAAHVMDDLNGRIDLILDGGSAMVGVESTVLDVTRTPPMILRPGGVSREAIEEVIGKVDLRNNKPNIDDEAQVSPGLLGKHYTPRAELILFSGEKTWALEQISRMAAQFSMEGRSVGLLLAEDDLSSFESITWLKYPLGSSNDLEAIARNLYAGMRTLDDKNAQVILTRDFGSQGLGLAIHDRLLRAAGRVIS
jgi:L-threonylcarbamoyladenylate synthase